MRSGVIKLFTAAQFTIPTLLYAQAQCGKNGLQFTPFLATGHATVQVRCRCSDRGTSHNDWFLQFRNDGPSNVAVEYYLTNAGRSEGPRSLDLGAHRVTPFIRARMHGCLFDDQLFTTVSNREIGAAESVRGSPTNRQEAPPAPEPSPQEEDAIATATAPDWQQGPSIIVGATSWKCSLLREDLPTAPQIGSEQLASCAVRGSATHVHLKLPKTWKLLPVRALHRYLQNGNLARGDHGEPKP